MICPRCGNEWDATKSPCTRCGLVILLPNQSGSASAGYRPSTSQTPQQGGSQPLRNWPPNEQRASEGTPSQPLKQQGGSGANPFSGASPAGQRFANPYSSSGNGMSSPAQPPTQRPRVSRSESSSPSGPLARGAQSRGDMSSFSTPPTSAASPFARDGLSNASSFPAQQSDYQRPFLFSATPVPETPLLQSSMTPAPAVDEQSLHTPDHFYSENTLRGEQSQEKTARVRIDNLSSRGVPQRPHVQSSPSIDDFQSDMQKPQSQSPSFRASRLTADPGMRNNPGRQSPPLHSLRPSSSSTSFSSAKNGEANDAMQVQSLAAGTLLRGGRYRLHEQRGRQDWLSGSYEAMWVAQDAQRGGSQVAICELVLPDNASIVIQTFLGSATRSLSQVGRHPHIPTLWDAFSDKGRSFFVFEPVDGESLLARMRRTGRAMPEQDVIECCLQMTEILELLAQQSPPLMHGLISPEHIFSTRNGSQYVLTSFSLVLAGGATQFIAGIDRSQLTPYAAPEFTRGAIDVRSDLYSLLATAYHAVTGSVPSGVSGSIPSAQRLNPNVSAEFDAILSKGLRPIAAQRYQRPSELRHDLLAMRSVSGSLVPGGVQSAAARSFQNQQNQPTSAIDIATQEAFKPVAQALQSIVPLEDDEDKKNLLPRPEELPPMPRTSVQFSTGVMLGIILLGMIILVAVSRGF